MSGSKLTYAARLEAWLDQHRPAHIDPEHVVALLDHLSPIKPQTIHRLLRQSGYSLHPLVESVRQDSLDNLQRTLSALSGIYPSHPHDSRQAVLTARRNAEWAVRRHPDDAGKNEALLWLRTWLENPNLFPTWCKLRRAATRESSEIKSAS